MTPVGMGVGGSVGPSASPNPAPLLGTGGDRPLEDPAPRSAIGVTLRGAGGRSSSGGLAR